MRHVEQILTYMRASTRRRCCGRTGPSAGPWGAKCGHVRGLRWPPSRAPRRCAPPGSCSHVPTTCPTHGTRPRGEAGSPPAEARTC